MNRREFTKISAGGFLGMGLSPLLSATPGSSSVTFDLNKGITDIGNRLELFVDDFMVEKLEKTEFRLHHPQKLPLPESPLTGGYVTVIKEGHIYHGYYRDIIPGYEGPTYDGHSGEITCYAVSIDGHEWIFPELDIVNVVSPRGRNVILAEPNFCHNFSPFLDTRPGIDKTRRFKALAGASSRVGLYAFASEDGLRWKKMHDKPAVTYGSSAFDSQNVCFWSETEQRYLSYFRIWTRDESRRGLRTIGCMSSEDFINWTEPVAMTPNLPGEHLYTSQTHPYFRAPHIYIALPTRFTAGRVGMEKANPMRGSTDIMLMTQRAGAASYDRLFKEAFIRPGNDIERWGNRANYVALNVVPTGENEMSVYHTISGHRYVLRTDGFVSVRAGAEKGELITRPLIFDGKNLLANYSTSAAGSLQVEIQEPDGTPVKGFSLGDCETVVGDKIDGIITWKPCPDLHKLSGKPVRLRFVMTECDLYSFRFTSGIK